MDRTEPKWSPIKMPTRISRQYQDVPVDDVDEVDEEDEVGPAQRGGPRRGLTQLFAVLLLGIFFIAGMATQYIVQDVSSMQIPHPSNNPTYGSEDPILAYTCGNSSAEALALGCTFDRLTLTWMPTQCPRDETDKFIERLGPTGWQFYHDKEHTVEIESVDALSKLGDEQFHTTVHLHSYHCMFIFTRFYDVMKRGGRVDALSASSGHWSHCLELVLRLIDENPIEQPDAAARIKFNGC